MATHRIVDMTVEELNELIETAIDRRLQALFKSKTTRTTSEILASIEKNRIGAQSYDDGQVYLRARRYNPRIDVFAPDRIAPEMQ
jgi:hypothetical protein